MTSKDWSWSSSGRKWAFGLGRDWSLRSFGDEVSRKDMLLGWTLGDSHTLVDLTLTQVLRIELLVPGNGSFGLLLSRVVLHHGRHRVLLDLDILWVEHLEACKLISSHGQVWIEASVVPRHAKVLWDFSHALAEHVASTLVPVATLRVDRVVSHNRGVIVVIKTDGILDYGGLSGILLMSLAVSEHSQLDFLVDEGKRLLLVLL